MGGDRVRLRAAGPDDVDALHELIAELATNTGLARKYHGSPAAYRKHGFGERRLFEALVAEEGKTIVAVSLYFYTYSSWRGEPGVYVQDLVVAPDSRGRGIGRKLLAETARVARGNGATHLRLAVDRDNASAMRFYKECGLSPTDDDRIFQGAGAAFAELCDAT